MAFEVFPLPSSNCYTNAVRSFLAAGRPEPQGGGVRGLLHKFKSRNDGPRKLCETNERGDILKNKFGMKHVGKPAAA